MKIQSLFLLLLVAAAGCATTSGDYSLEASQASVAGRHAEAAALYTKSAEVAKAAGDAYAEAEGLRSAADARAFLLKDKPGEADIALNQYRRARDLYAKAPMPAWTPRADLMGNISLGMATVYANSNRPSEATASLIDVLRVCAGEATDGGYCYTALNMGGNLARRLGDRRLGFELRYLLLQGSSLESRILVAYDPLKAEAEALGLGAQADLIARSKAAVLQVEGPNPNPSAYISADPVQLKRIVATLRTQSQQYARLGIDWLATVRSLEAAKAIKSSQEIAENSRLVAELHAEVERNKAQSRASQQRSWDELQRVLGARAGVGTPAGASAQTAAKGRDQLYSSLSQCLYTRASRIPGKVNTGNNCNFDIEYEDKDGIFGGPGYTRSANQFEGSQHFDSSKFPAKTVCRRNDSPSSQQPGMCKTDRCKIDSAECGSGSTNR